MWIDRLTQKKQTTLPTTIEAGRYQLCLSAASSGSDELNRFNKHSALKPGKLLVSDGSEYWRLPNSNGNFQKPAIDDPEYIGLLKNAILTLGEHLNKTADLNCQHIKPEKLLSPLLPATVINSEITLLPFEKTLQKVLKAGHLHEIAHHPRLDIRYIEETTDIARAKRMAKGALVHLASHSECWQRQTLSGIVPKKIKARFSEDDYQIYENRVFARLIDKLNRHLSSRIRTIEQLQQTLNDALEFENSAIEIDYRIRERICTLWGQTFDAEGTLAALELLENTLSSLKDMLTKVSSLRQTGLYLMIPRDAQIAGELHRTNILNHDTHYRYLAILWDELNRLQQSAQLSPSERFEREQLLASHYSRYAGLVLNHALRGNTQIHPKSSTQTSGKTSTDATTVIDYRWAGQTLRLQQQGYDWTLSLTQQKNDAQTPVTNSKPLLQFTPWLGFSAIPEITDTLACNRVILWPSVSNISNSQAESEQSNWYALSPLDLYCVERLGCLLDKKLNKLLTKQYAKPILKIPRQPEEVILSIKKHHNSAIELSGKPPQTRVLENLKPEDASEIKKALNDSNALPQKEHFELQLALISALSSCLVCGKHSQLKHQAPSGFRVECDNCSTKYYLTNPDDDLEIRFKENDINAEISSDFAAYGRWAKAHSI